MGREGLTLPEAIRPRTNLASVGGKLDGYAVVWIRPIPWKTRQWKGVWPS